MTNLVSKVFCSQANSKLDWQTRVAAHLNVKINQQSGLWTMVWIDEKRNDLATDKAQTKKKKKHEFREDSFVFIVCHTHTRVFAE